MLEIARSDRCGALEMGERRGDEAGVCVASSCRSLLVHPAAVGGRTRAALVCECGVRAARTGGAIMWACVVQFMARAHNFAAP